jgi:hypothetical protein
MIIYERCVLCSSLEEDIHAIELEGMIFCEWCWGHGVREIIKGILKKYEKETDTDDE